MRVARCEISTIHGVTAPIRMLGMIAKAEMLGWNGYDYQDAGLGRWTGMLDWDA